MDDKHLGIPEYRTAVREIRWLSSITFELIVEKPSGFFFKPGQKVTCIVDGYRREYTLVSSPHDKSLVLCVRHVEKGVVSSRLASLLPGDMLPFSAAYGFFLHRPGKSVFVATGTGIAPFVSFCRSGVRGFMLLHGVADVAELYYQADIEGAVQQYIPCITRGYQGAKLTPEVYQGRVTQYLQEMLPQGKYNFYLCGNGEMIKDVLRLIDAKFKDSRVFTETFYVNE